MNYKIDVPFQVEHADITPYLNHLFLCGAIIGLLLCMVTFVITESCEAKMSARVWRRYRNMVLLITILGVGLAAPWILTFIFRQLVIVGAIPCLPEMKQVIDLPFSVSIEQNYVMQTDWTLTQWLPMLCVLTSFFAIPWINLNSLHVKNRSLKGVETTKN